MYLSSLRSIQGILQDPISKAEETEAIEVSQKVISNALELERSASGSWRGKHASVYYKGLRPAPEEASYLYFEQIPVPFSGLTVVGTLNPPQYYFEATPRSSDNWHRYSNDQIRKHIFKGVDDERYESLSGIAHTCERLFHENRDRILSQLRLSARQYNDQSLSDLSEAVNWFHIKSESDVIEAKKSQHENPSIRSNRVADNEERIPPHIEIYAHAKWIHDSIATVKRLVVIVDTAIDHLAGLDLLAADTAKETAPTGHKIFIGHGQSDVWKMLKTYLESELELTVDEFNQVPAAGRGTFERLQQMVNDAAIAFLVMTGDDKLANGKLHPRLNVVHEAGLFQCRLGKERAIILLEEGCERFSNSDGITYISFRKNKISETFIEIKDTLEREGILESEP